MTSTRKGPLPGTGGRPPKAPEERRVHTTVRLAPETDRIIETARRAGESYSATIDRLVQRSTDMATARDTYRNTVTGEYWIAEGPAGGIAVTGVQGPLTADQAFPDLSGDEWPELDARPKHDAATIRTFLDLRAAGTLILA